MTDIFAKLAAPFPPEAIHWRAQTLTKDGTKALALAYLDARDVMERLDEAASPENWQDAYIETPRGRVICSISIRHGDAWISKSDGAGDTAVEGEKGGISDAFKRAAVKWGVGRYLYDLGNVWAPCEVNQNGKWRAWKREAQAVFERALAALEKPPSESDPISDEARDWIADKLTARQLHVGDLCAAMEVTSLKALTYGQMDAVKDWIRNNTKEAA